MMAQRILWLLNAGLAMALAWLWVDETWQLRSQEWVAPAPLAPSAFAPAPDAATGIPANPAQYMAILDRPVFAPDRRPPPPPDAPASPPPPDPLENLTLYGVFGNAEQGGVLVKAEGRLRRIRTGEGLGEWTVQSVQGRQVSLTRGDETRTLTLAHVYGARPKTDAPATAAAGAPPVPLDRQAMQAQAMDEARERLRQRNELFRKAGLPLAKE